MFASGPRSPSAEAREILLQGRRLRRLDRVPQLLQDTDRFARSVTNSRADLPAPPRFAASLYGGFPAGAVVDAAIDHKKLKKVLQAGRKRSPPTGRCKEDRSWFPRSGRHAWARASRWEKAPRSACICQCERGADFMSARYSRRTSGLRQEPRQRAPVQRVRPARFSNPACRVRRSPVRVLVELSVFRGTRPARRSSRFAARQR